MAQPDGTERPASAGRRGRDGVELTVPSAPVWAVVRTDHPPDDPPDDLRAFTTRQGDDWALTDDAVAFGPADVVQRFAAWRSGWERTWVLDPLTNVVRLITLDDEEVTGRLARIWRRHRAEDGDVVLPPEVHHEVTEAIDELGHRIRERAEPGYGIVDTSPGSERTGLARGWPGWGADEVVAAIDHVAIVYRPASGLRLEVGADRSDVGAIAAAAADETGWSVTTTCDGATTVTHLDRLEARPVAWLVPSATEWRVRSVPAVVTMANTITRLPESLQIATYLGVDVRLTVHRPIAPTGTATPG